MALRSGLAGQLGIAAETTWNTYAAPDHWYEPESENINHNWARITTSGLRAGERVQRTDRWVATNHDIAGDFPLEILNKGHGLLFKHALGGAAIAADGAGWKQTFTLGDSFGLGLSVQVGRPDTGGTVRPFSYTGCKVQSAEWSNATNGMLMAKYTINGAAETTAQALGTASFPSSAEVFHFEQGALTLNGASTYNISDWSINVAQGIKTDRYFVGSTGTKKEQLINAFTQISGNLTAEFDSLNAYNLFLNGTIGSLVLTYTTTTTYDTAKPYKVVFTVQNVRVDGNTPNLTGPDVLNTTLNWVGLNDSVNPAIKIEYYSSDTAP